MVDKIDNLKIPYLGINYSEEEAQRKIDNYINDLKEFSASTKPANLLDFFPLVQKAIRTREEFEDVPNCKGLLILEDDPPEEIDTESITWELVARMPGRFDQGPAGRGNIKEVRPHTRAMINHPEHPSEKLVTMGKFRGNWIDFNIYARDSKTALRRLIWFNEVMDAFYWYFRVHGFIVIEQGSGKKEKVKIKDLELVKYPLSYFVRSDDTYHITTQELKRVLIDVNISNC